MTEQVDEPTGWQVEQDASAAYERYLVPAIFAPWADRLLETGGVAAGDRVLDVACGTGIVARRAAAAVGGRGEVVGVDINDGMLAVAAESAGDHGQSIDWRVGDAIELPAADGRFDVVCCQQALQFFDVPTAAAAEMHRVLTPGGRLALSVWRPVGFHPAYVALADALEHHVSEAAGGMMRSPFPAWDGAHLRKVMRDGGFDDPSVTIEIGAVRYPSVDAFVRREAASSPLAESIAAVDRSVQETLVDTVRESLEAYLDDEGIVAPMETYVVAADRPE